MKLKGSLSGNLHEISLCLAEGAVDVAVDDRHYDLQFRELASGEYLLISGSKVYKCRVSSHAGSVAGGQSFAVVLRGQTYEVAVVDPKRLRSGESSGGHHAGAAEIVSPMPGKIVRVLLHAGDKVEAGAGIIVVEAMKMQNEMKAPKTGTVVSINADEGETVNAGDVLAVVE
jgi:biotin carboxyl carrier protein